MAVERVSRDVAQAGAGGELVSAHSRPARARSDVGARARRGGGAQGRRGAGHRRARRRGVALDSRRGARRSHFPTRGGTRWCMACATAKNSCEPLDDRRRSIRSIRSRHFPRARPRRRHRAEAEHAARVPFLDGARFAGRHRDDRARRGRASGRTGRFRAIYGVVVEGFSYTDLQTPLHDVLGHDGTPGGASLAATERAEIRLYTAAVLRQVPEEPLQPVPMGAGVSRRRRRRRRRAAHGRLSAATDARTAIPDRRLSRRRHRRADLSRRRLSARPRGGAPQHHRRVRARDEDERGRVAPAVDLRALSRSRRARSPRSAST